MNIHTDHTDNKCANCTQCHTTADIDHEDTATVLNSMYNNCIMSVSSITTLNKYVTKDSISNILHTMTEQHSSYKQRIMELAGEQGVELKQVNGAVQSMANASMRMKMLSDNSSEHAVSILVQGVYMGVIDMYKLLNHVDDIEPHTLSLARDLLSYHEQSADKLKQYL